MRFVAHAPPRSAARRAPDEAIRPSADDTCKVPAVIHAAAQGHDEGLHRLTLPLTRGLAPVMLVPVVGGCLGGFSAVSLTVGGSQ